MPRKTPRPPLPGPSTSSRVLSLLQESGRSAYWVAAASGVPKRTVEKWYTGGPIESGDLDRIVSGAGLEIVVRERSA